MDNHYAVLNIAMDAPEAVVRAAYRVLAAQFHPDRHAADPAGRGQASPVTRASRRASRAVPVPVTTAPASGWPSAAASQAAAVHADA